MSAIEAARRALDAARGDDEFVRRYLDGDRNAFAYMQGLMQAAYPDAGPGEDADESPRPAADLPATLAGDGGGTAMPDWLREAGDAGFAPPKSPAHYQLDYAPNAEIDPAFDRMARDWMFKAELPAGWAGEIARDYQRRAAKPPSADEIAQEREAVLGRLRHDWGDATDAKLTQVRDLVLRAGDDRLAETLDRTGLGNNEWLVRQLAILADRNVAKAVGKGEGVENEDSESNGGTGTRGRGVGRPPIENNSNPYIQLSDKTGTSGIGETVGPEIVPVGGAEAANDSQLNERTGYSGGGKGGGGDAASHFNSDPSTVAGTSLIGQPVDPETALFSTPKPSVDLFDIASYSEDGLRQRMAEHFGPDFYARTGTVAPPPGIGKIGLFRFGNWAGQGYCGRHTSPSFLALTDPEKRVPPIRNADGKVNLFDFVSKEHDEAYDTAQQKLLDDLSDPNKSAAQAYHSYHSALAQADIKFLKDIRAGLPDMSLSGDPWETAMISRAKLAFEATSVKNQWLADQYKPTKSDIGNRYGALIGDRSSALNDAHLKLQKLSEMVNSEVVGSRVRAVMDQLNNRIVELGGRPPIQSYGEAFAYVSNPEEAEKAFARRK